MHEPVLSDLPSLSRRELQFARTLWQELGACEPEATAGNGGGDPSLSLPELSLPSLPTLQERNAEGNQATVRQVRTSGLDMCCMPRA